MSRVFYQMSGENEGKSFAAKAGNVMHFSPDLSYVSRCDADAPFVHMTVNFQLSEKNALAMLPLCMTSVNGQKIAQLFSRLIHEWTKRHDYYRIYSLSFLYELIGDLLKEINREHDSYRRKLRRPWTIWTNTSAIRFRNGFCRRLCFCYLVDAHRFLSIHIDIDGFQQIHIDTADQILHPLLSCSSDFSQSRDGYLFFPDPGTSLTDLGGAPRQKGLNQILPLFEIKIWRCLKNPGQIPVRVEPVFLPQRMDCCPSDCAV